MKKLFVLSTLIPLAIISSCQKQDVSAEQQLAQRKVELDARERALDEREKALAEREKAVARTRTLPADLQMRALNRDGSAAKVVPAPSIPPGLVPTQDTTQLKTEREKRIQERLAQRQRRLEAAQKMRSIGAQANPATGAPADTGGSADTGASASTGAEASSPSPTPQ
jgi:hypothetical protein